ERQAALGEMNKALRPDASAARSNASIISSNQVAATNTVASSNAVALTPASIQESNNPAADSTNLVEVQVPSAKVAEYKHLTGLLDRVGKSQEELLRSFTPESSRVKAILAQIADAEAQKQKLETEHPGLLAVKVTETKATDSSSGSHFDFAAETARVTALQSKIKVLNGQLATITKQASRVDEVEGAISELQRIKELQEGN